MNYKLVPAKRKKIIIKINTQTIKLDSFLKFSGIAETGGDAKYLINEKKIKVNGEICLQRGKKLKDKDVVSYMITDYEIVYED